MFNHFKKLQEQREKDVGLIEHQQPSKPNSKLFWTVVSSVYTKESFDDDVIRTTTTGYFLLSYSASVCADGALVAHYIQLTYDTSDVLGVYKMLKTHLPKVEKPRYNKPFKQDKTKVKEVMDYYQVGTETANSWLELGLLTSDQLKAAKEHHNSVKGKQ